MLYLSNPRRFAGARWRNGRAWRGWDTLSFSLYTSRKFHFLVEFRNRHRPANTGRFTHPSGIVTTGGFNEFGSAWPI
ncbi:hypothetical protein AV530_008401 [Patagioenas fasciata monilis]|uniref:Uncharacterized protein n=1 Tax=Patagioenas fasciata monilis TaxID=372326 RepID=A0A1V4JTE3_PATFA|nr:hypothetical protein AV530_008401 [Patagioenas fasciata monilis]